MPETTNPQMIMYLRRYYKSQSTEYICFVVEARKASGEYYPPSSLHQLLCGILHHMREINTSGMDHSSTSTSRARAFLFMFVLKLVLNAL